MPRSTGLEPRARKRRVRPVLPGLALCVAAAGTSYGFSLLAPGMSPLIIAIVLGLVLANIVGVPDATTAGIDFSAKQLLRAGIVFLGLRLVLTDIVDLGAPMLIVVVTIVGTGLFGTILMGRLLKVPPHLALLIACGFSICGAAAVAGAAGVTDPDDKAEEDTVTAVALVVIFGTLMIALLPVAANLFGLGAETAGRWAGGSIHEIAQVVAAGGVIGGSALTVAVIVKLARVLLLAPIVAALSIGQRRLALANIRAADAVHAPTSRLPAIVPPFIIGFLAMVLLRSFVPLPALVLTTAEILQTGLLAAAMFGLGCGVKISNLVRVGGKPFALAALSTLLVTATAYIGVILVA